MRNLLIFKSNGISQDMGSIIFTKMREYQLHCKSVALDDLVSALNLIKSLEHEEFDARYLCLFNLLVHFRDSP